MSNIVAKKQHTITEVIEIVNRYKLAQKRYSIPYLSDAEYKVRSREYHKAVRLYDGIIWDDSLRELYQAYSDNGSKHNGK